MLVALWIALILVAVIWIAPFVFIVFTSLKTNTAVMGETAFALPTDPAFSNYAKAWARGNFSVTAFNGVLITLQYSGKASEGRLDTGE